MKNKLNAIIVVAALAASSVAQANPIMDFLGTKTGVGVVVGGVLAGATGGASLASLIAGGVIGGLVGHSVEQDERLANAEAGLQYHEGRIENHETKLKYLYKNKIDKQAVRSDSQAIPNGNPFSDIK